MKDESPLGVFLASHEADTGMKDWDLERWTREVQELKRMGANTVWYLPIQFGQKTPDDFAPGSAHWELQKAISRMIHEEGLKVGVYQGLNDVFTETWSAHQDWQSPNGHFFLEEAHVCSSIPDAWSAVMALRKRFFAELPFIDYLITPATDYGGCGCERCQPWPETYLARFEEQVALARETHPGLKAVAAGHGLNLQEEDLLREKLRNADWVDFVADIPRGCGKLAVKYYMTPEITMLGGWGKFGPCPILEVITRLYRADRDGVGGHVPYSEGVHDHINRYACLRLAKEPDLQAVTLAEDYAREWLGCSEEASVRVGEVLLEMGAQVHTIDSIRGTYVNPEDFQDGTDADQRLKVLLEEFPDYTEMNLQQLLLIYRALAESMSCVGGLYASGQLMDWIGASLKGFRRVEPSFARFLEGLHPTLRPGRSLWFWPRSYAEAWGRELAFSLEVR